MSRVVPLWAVTASAVLLLYTLNGVTAKGPAFPAKLTKSASSSVCGSLWRTVGRSRRSLISPGYNSGGYANNVHCEWTLKAQGSKKLRLKFSALKLKHDPLCNEDYVAIYDVPSGRQMAKLCGNQCRSQITMPSKKALVVFHTNAFRRHRGFKLKFWRVSNNIDERVLCGCTDGVNSGCLECASTMTAPTGTLMSTNFPMTYPNDLDCVWTITVENAMHLNFRTLVVDIEYHGTCDYDSLSLARYGASEPQMRLCGDDCLPEIVVSHHQAMVRFVTDYSVRSFGFEIDYEAISPGTSTWGDDLLVCHCPADSGCSGPGAVYIDIQFEQQNSNCSGGLYTEPSGDIFSPNWPYVYSNNALCVYNISIPGSPGLLLTFEHFQIEDEWNCGYDAVHIVSDLGFSESLCGTRYGDLVVRGENISLVFSTDHSVVDTGFHIHYEVLNGDNGGGGGGGGNSTGGGTPGPPIDCNVFLTGSSGNVSSPGYPGNYPNDIRCYINITVEAGKVVQLQMVAFNLESATNCVYDKLSVFFGNGQQLFYCGNYFPYVMTSTDNTVLLAFESDSSVVSSGFSFLYSAVDPPDPGTTGGEVACGVLPSGGMSALIVGGSDATPHAYPWMVVLREHGSIICGGSIVDRNWVITAAHCLDESASYSIEAGAHSIAGVGPTHQVRQVAQLIIHADYNAWTNENDIALLRLSSPLDWTLEVRPICIPETSDPVGTSCVITGWGNTETYGFPDILQFANVPLLSNSECDAAVGDIYDSMLCAGYMAGGIDTCQVGGGVIPEDPWLVPILPPSTPCRGLPAGALAVPMWAILESTLASRNSPTGSTPIQEAQCKAPKKSMGLSTGKNNPCCGTSNTGRHETRDRTGALSCLPKHVVPDHGYVGLWMMPHIPAQYLGGGIGDVPW